MEAKIIPDKIRKEWEKQHYRIVGNNSAVKICNWTKKSLRDQGVCYKEKFYGVKSHRCLQMSPSAFWCTNRCLTCWRRIEAGVSTNINEHKLDEPKEILLGAIEAQKLLLSGFKGFEKTNRRKLKEAQKPSNIAISLVGEPTEFPMLSGLIEESHRMNMVTFLVTNGQNPNALKNLTEPRQLYISVNAPDEKTNKLIERPLEHDHWKLILNSLEIMNSLSCRKVLRLTMVKGWNMKDPKGYSKLIEIADPDYIELKAYMFVGESRNRLEMENMPSHSEVREFSEKVSEECGYPVKDEQKASRVVLLSRK